MNLLWKLLFCIVSWTLIANCKDHTRNKDHMQEIHKKMDQDGDGQISLAEVLAFARSTTEGMEVESIADSMDEYDENEDGKIDLDEIMGSSKMEEKDQESKDLEKEKFKAADKNKDGFLDKDEIGYIMHPETNPDVLKVLTAHSIKTRDANGDGKLDSTEFYETAEDVEKEFAKKEFAELDRDGDGKLSDEEFQRYESGEYHMHTAFKDLFANADTDKDSHLSLAEFLKHGGLSNSTEVSFHLNEWITHHEL